ncbi:MAG: hypothetical protein ACLR8Y_09420 [Alistipes indistinctus]
MKITPKEGLKRFVVKIEINHSTDFNEFYPHRPAKAIPTTRAAKWAAASPQSSDAATVDLSSGRHEFPAALIRAQQPRRKRRVCRSGPLDAHLGITHRQGIVIRTRP